MLTRINATAFIDWNSQLWNAGQLNEQRASRQTERTLEYFASAIESALSGYSNIDLFAVALRFYYGWHRGLTPTPARRAFKDLLAQGLQPTGRGRIRFDWRRAFGDILLDASTVRLHPSVRIHLPDTLRKDTANPSIDREKMVDTAMVADVLQSARTEPDSWRLLFVEDDDVVPAAFVAEQWSKNKGGRTHLIRRRLGSGHLNLQGLLINIP
jgi:hypothetical protein